MFFCLLFQQDEKLFNLVDYMRRFARFGTFVQLKKREKHSWRSVTSSKLAECSLQLY